MSRKKEKFQSPEEIFRTKLWAECHKAPGLTVKIEKVPRGSMSNHKVEYISACSLDALHIESYLQRWLGDGDYLLKFVDENCCPLEEFGNLWISLAFESCDEFEVEMAEARVELVKARMELQGLQNKAFFDCAADIMIRRSCNPTRVSYEPINTLMMACLAKADEKKDNIERIGQLAATMSSQQRQLAEQKAAKTKKVASDMICSVFQALQESGQLPDQQKPAMSGPIQQLSEQEPQASKPQSHTQFDPKPRFARHNFGRLRSNTTTVKDGDNEA